jgi:hypothetical protein
MSKHTARPWQTGLDFNISGRILGDGGTSPIADVLLFGEPADERAKANAALIVKCVNMHDELVTALNGALVALKLGAYVDQQSAIDYGMEVLAKAEAGE